MCPKKMRKTALAAIGLKKLRVCVCACTNQTSQGPGLHEGMPYLGYFPHRNLFLIALGSV